MRTTPIYIDIAERIKAEWLLGRDALGGKKLPTQEELVAHFGVSRSTIIRSLSKLVAEGYLHSYQGRGVYVADKPPQENVMNCISMIVPNLHATVIVSACRGVERRARELGYQVLLASSEFGLAHEQELVEQHLQAGAKGIILYPVTRRQQEMENDYLLHWNRDVPVVAMDIGYKNWPCSRVQFDNYRLGYDMTQLLLRHRHRHIAFVHTWPDFLHTSITERQRGWETAMAEAGLEIPASYRTWPQEALGLQSRPPLVDTDYEAIVDSLLTLDPRPDAVIAWDDSVAVHLIQSLINRGINVPDDIRIAGFDCDPSITRLFRPLFPTSKPDFVRLGGLAVDALTEILADERANSRICYYYPASVVWREAASVSGQEPVVATRSEAVVESY